jgi:hypothetical protein
MLLNLPLVWFIKSQSEDFWHSRSGPDPQRRTHGPIPAGPELAPEDAALVDHAVESADGRGGTFLDDGLRGDDSDDDWPSDPHDETRDRASYAAILVATFGEAPVRGALLRRGAPAHDVEEVIRAASALLAHYASQSSEEGSGDEDEHVSLDDRDDLERIWAAAEEGLTHVYLAADCELMQVWLRDLPQEWMRRPSFWLIGDPAAPA